MKNQYTNLYIHCMNLPLYLCISLCNTIFSMEKVVFEKKTYYVTSINYGTYAESYNLCYLAADGQENVPLSWHILTRNNASHATTVVIDITKYELRKKLQIISFKNHLTKNKELYLVAIRPDNVIAQKVNKPYTYRSNTCVDFMPEINVSENDEMHGFLMIVDKQARLMSQKFIFHHT